MKRPKRSRSPEAVRRRQEQGHIATKDRKTGRWRIYRSKANKTKDRIKRLLSDNLSIAEIKKILVDDEDTKIISEPSYYKYINELRGKGIIEEDARSIRRKEREEEEE